MTSGPFRQSWIALGYDPRSDPHSAVYQILDMRASKSSGRQVLDEFIDKASLPPTPPQVTVAQSATDEVVVDDDDLVKYTKALVAAVMGHVFPEVEAMLRSEFEPKEGWIKMKQLKAYVKSKPKGYGE